MTVFFTCIETARSGGISKDFSNAKTEGNLQVAMSYYGKSSQKKIFDSLARNTTLLSYSEIVQALVEL